MISLKKTFLRGSFPPLATPFREGRIDYDKYTDLIEVQIKEGSHGVGVSGTTGEPSSLSIEERIELLKVAVSAAAGRIQVVAATGSQSLVDTLKLTVNAAKVGA